VAAWSAATVYTGGATASFEGKNYRAKWWTQGDRPSAGGPWEATGACGGTTPTTPPTTPPTNPPTTPPTTPGTCTAPAWSATVAYTGGATVSYQGQSYRAKWWTQNNVPGAEQYGPWQALGAC
ncbi:carbohydrate-binding protein, partial [Cellulosimicrobium funkei]|uniref:carbohydrate-binding protein n=2 Tax=Cellulosimicrobium TaxID=157920 RepID=UPI003F9094BE